MRVHNSYFYIVWLIYIVSITVKPIEAAKDTTMDLSERTFTEIAIISSVNIYYLFQLQFSCRRLAGDRLTCIKMYKGQLAISDKKIAERENRSAND